MRWFCSGMGDYVYAKDDGYAGRAWVCSFDPFKRWHWFTTDERSGWANSRAEAMLAAVPGSNPI